MHQLSSFAELCCCCHCLIKTLPAAGLPEYVATHSQPTGYLHPCELDTGKAKGVLFRTQMSTLVWVIWTHAPLRQECTFLCFEITIAKIFDWQPSRNRKKNNKIGRIWTKLNGKKNHNPADTLSDESEYEIKFCLYFFR